MQFADSQEETLQNIVLKMNTASHFLLNSVLISVCLTRAYARQIGEFSPKRHLTTDHKKFGYLNTDPTLYDNVHMRKVDRARTQQYHKADDPHAEKQNIYPQTPDRKQPNSGSAEKKFTGFDSTYRNYAEVDEHFSKKQKAEKLHFENLHDDHPRRSGRKLKFNDPMLSDKAYTRYLSCLNTARTQFQINMCINLFDRGAFSS